MKYGILRKRNGVAVLTRVKEIDQATMTGDCWDIQLNGPTACKSCEDNKRSCCGRPEVKK